MKWISITALDVKELVGADAEGWMALLNNVLL